MSPSPQESQLGDLRAPRRQKAATSMGGLKGPSIDRVDAIVDEEQKKYVGQLCKAAPDMKSFEASYVKPLFRLIASTLSRDHLRDDQDLQDQVKKEIVKCGSEIYEQVGREVLGPLVVRFAECVLKHAPPGSTVAFLARDAQPYFEAARVLNKREDLASKGLNVRYVTLNRGHLQIADENLEKGGLKPRDSAQEKLIDAYLAQEGFGNPRGVVIVDTGCWGTMIQKLLEEAQVRGPDKLNIQQVFFMYSRNDSIFGFVNEVAKAHGPSKLAKQGVFIADTFEGLPKGEESSKEFAQVSDGPVSPIPRPIDSDYLAEWQEAVLRGVRESTAAYLQSPELFPTAGQALSILEDNRLEAKNSFTGVLPHATPEWSDGKGFLKGWTLSDIPPVNGLVDI